MWKEEGSGRGLITDEPGVLMSGSCLNLLTCELGGQTSKGGLLQTVRTMTGILNPIK